MRISTGNKGVDQLSLTFFSKCGITFFLFPLVVALFCIMGCVELAPSPSQASSQMEEHQQAEDGPSSLQVDFDAGVSSSLFHVQGNIMVVGNGSFPYLLLNATLSQDGIPMRSTKYLLLNVEPGEDHGFEISKNMRILPGSYNCTLEVAGPRGTLTSETRRCKGSMPWLELSPVAKPTVNILLETASKKAELKMEKEMIREAEDREEKIQEEKVKEEVVSDRSGDESRPEEVAEESRALPKVSSKVPPKKEDSQAENASQENYSSSQAGPSVKASSALSTRQERLFVGSSTSKKYHRLDCHYAAKIKPENKIYFSGEDDARLQDYLPCKTCNP